MLFLTYSIFLFLFAFSPSSLGAIESKDSESTLREQLDYNHESITQLSISIEDIKIAHKILNIKKKFFSILDYNPKKTSIVNYNPKKKNQAPIEKS